VQGPEAIILSGMGQISWSFRKLPFMLLNAYILIYFMVLNLTDLKPNSKKSGFKNL
jgi:hypothetical protein